MTSGTRSKVTFSTRGHMARSAAQSVRLGCPMTECPPSISKRFHKMKYVPNRNQAKSSSSLKRRALVPFPEVSPGFPCLCNCAKTLILPMRSVSDPILSARTSRLGGIGFLLASARPSHPDRQPTKKPLVERKLR